MTRYVWQRQLAPAARHSSLAWLGLGLGLGSGLGLGLEVRGLLRGENARELASGERPAGGEGDGEARQLGARRL